MRYELSPNYVPCPLCLKKWRVMSPAPMGAPPMQGYIGIGGTEPLMTVSFNIERYDQICCGPGLRYSFAYPSRTTITLCDEMFVVVYAVVTCEIKLFHNYFSLRRRPTGIILFQRVETCPKLFRNYFTGLLQLVNILQHVSG